MNLQDLDAIEMPEIKKITDRISYVPATLKPLSSDIGIVRGDSRLYLYDVGSTLPDLKFINSLPDDKAIVISHFHGDHTWWLTDHKHGEHGVANDDNISTDYRRPGYSDLYVSTVSARYCSTVTACSTDVDEDVSGEPESAEMFRDCTIVKSPVLIEDGVRIEIVPVPCTHCKGSLVMVVDDEYAFVGDSTYPNKINGVTFYNAQLLQSEIEVLESLKAGYFLLSHDSRFIRPKNVILRQLKAIYGKWDKTDHLIRIS